MFYLLFFIVVAVFIYFVNQQALKNGHNFKASKGNGHSSSDMTFGSSSGSTLGSDYLDNTMISGKW